MEDNPIVSINQKANAFTCGYRSSAKNELSMDAYKYHVYMLAYSYLI